MGFEPGTFQFLLQRLNPLTLSACLLEELVIVLLVLLKWEVAAILGKNGCGVQGQNYVAWLHGSKVLVGGGKVGEW